MEDWKIVLLTGIISIASSIITAIITLRITHKNDVKRLVLENRTVLYFELYSAIEPLLHDNSKVFDSNYIDILVKYKPKMKLLSSSKTFEAFKVFYNIVTEKFNEFRKYCHENDPRTKPEFCQTVCDEEGKEYEICHASDLEIYYFECDVEKFKNNNTLSTEIISNKLTELYKNMRNDLGSNIK